MAHPFIEVSGPRSVLYVGMTGDIVGRETAIKCWRRSWKIELVEK